MTITLAAVYAPIGIQGGLTGALFREFAFTLAGAVIVSGVVALTLSPMMGSKLLRAGDTERGFAGWINRRFESVRDALHAHAVAARCATGRSSSSLWAIVALLIVPFYMFSQRELAPAEDQGVVFGDRPGGGELHASIRPSCSRSRSTTSIKSFPESREHLPDHVAERRLRRHGDQAVERAHEDRAAAA